MTELSRIRLNVTEVEEAIGTPFADWSHNCHAVSFMIVNSDLLPDAGAPVRRVARGWCRGVLSQHSWIVLGHDVYDRKSPIIDPTLWSYDPTVHQILYTTSRARHRAHGSGSIFRTGLPQIGGGDPVFLNEGIELSDRARAFLKLLQPLDRQGWGQLFHGGMEGWPSREIISAAYQTASLRALIPIDIVGMLTDENPGECYLPVRVTT